MADRDNPYRTGQLRGRGQRDRARVRGYAGLRGQRSSRRDQRAGLGGARWRRASRSRLVQQRPRSPAPRTGSSCATLNIAHQGGEDEVPSNTMYAYERALRLGADMLEVDIHTTADGELVVLHDATVDRTTNGTRARLRHDARRDPGARRRPQPRPRRGHRGRAAPASDYPFRGVRTGERKPPPGFGPDDFRIPTLDEVMAAYPRGADQHRDQGRGGLRRRLVPAQRRGARRLPQRARADRGDHRRLVQRRGAAALPRARAADRPRARRSAASPPTSSAACRRRRGRRPSRCRSSSAGSRSSTSRSSTAPTATATPSTSGRSTTSRRCACCSTGASTGS